MDFTSLTPKQVLQLGQPCDEFKEALKSYKAPFFDWTDTEKALATLRQLVGRIEKSDQSDPEIQEETHAMSARDGAPLAVLVYRAARKVKTPSPLIVLYFPGGFVLGSPRAMAPIARLLVKQFNAVVALPTYRLAPEHPFPTGVNDGWDAFSWIAAHAVSDLGANPDSGFLVGGISSGGNVANAVAHLARDEVTQPFITGVWLSCAGARIAPQYEERLPVKYKERLLSRTQEECVNSVVTSPGMANLTRDALKPDIESNLYAPLIWPTEGGHKDFPKTYSQVCGMETSRDEALVFDDMLKCEGIPTRMDLYPGLPHTFWHSFRDLPQSKAWIEDTLEGFAWLLKS